MNRPLGAISRLGLGAAVAGAAMCVVALASVLPARAAVDLVSFDVEFGSDYALITWVTGNEMTTAGFYLYRADTPDLSAAHKLNEQMIEASGETTGDEYEYRDDGVVPGATYYWLEVVDSGGNEIFGPQPEPTPTPTSTSTATGTPTRTPTRTKTPTPTPTSIPTATPSFTGTPVPSATPTATPTSTPIPTTTPPAASATPVPEQASSPTATTAAVAPPTVTSDDAQSGVTPSSTSTTVAVASGESPGDEGLVPADSDRAAPRWSYLRPHWPAIQPSTVLLSISVVSLIGVLMLSLALVALRRLSL